MNKKKIVNFITAQLRKHPWSAELFKNIAREAFPEMIFLDYPVHPKQRWDREHPHQQLVDIINLNREVFKHHLQSFLAFQEYFIRIPVRQTNSAAVSEPSWINGWMPSLDGVALYSFIATNKPEYYMEVGSGNSTKFARKAILDHHLNTKIISIDPCPRAEINPICDEIIREPLENVNMNLFDRLKANDILYIDNSHRVFMNSDATAIFLDVIPRLKPGVFVEIHDVTLPYDYPAAWVDRYYSEQYLLAAYLLAKGNRFDIVLPNMFISNDKELNSILLPLWQKKEMAQVETHGCSFWFKIK